MCRAGALWSYSRTLQSVSFMPTRDSREFAGSNQVGTTNEQLGRPVWGSEGAKWERFTKALDEKIAPKTRHPWRADKTTSDLY